MAVEEELFAIRMELKGQREAVAGMKEVATAEKEVATQTGRTGTAAEKAEKKTSRLGASFAGLGTKAKWALGFLGVGGAFALESAVHKSEELGLTTEGLTRNFDLQTNVASRWAAVMASRELDPKALSMSFATLSSRLVEAGRKGGTALTPFHQLGLTQEEVTHGAHNFEWGLLRVANALGEEEGGAKRSTAAKALLGKGYQSLLPLFASGADGLKEQLHWADEYGVTLNTTTKEGLMEMVTGQRELKVASLGLQLALTKALMPAIHGGEEELKTFIKTLNDPDLTADQKIHRIEKQFLGIEDALIEIVTDAAPKIAEHGGELGIKLAGAVWHGFEESDLLGKLFVGAWLFNAMGGPSALARLGARAGGKLASALGWKFLTTVAPYFAAEAGVEGLGSALGSQMGGLKTVFGRYGRELGTVMGAAAAGAIVAEITFAIEDSENIAGLSLFNTPETDATSSEEEAQRLTERGYTGVGIENPHKISGTDPKGRHVTEVQKHGKWVQQGKGDPHGHGDSGRRPRRAAEPQRRETSGRDRVLQPIHIHWEADGRQLAELVHHHVVSDEALG